ncbi:endonuclease I, partial [Pseudoalteromonas sp. S1727]
MSHFLLALVLACLSFNLYAAQFTRFASAKKHRIKPLQENATSLYCGGDINRQGKILVPAPSACG